MTRRARLDAASHCLVAALPKRAHGEQRECVYGQVVTGGYILALWRG